MYRVGIMTVSDKGAAGVREDLSGPAIKEIMEQYEPEHLIFQVTKEVIVPDDFDTIKAQLIEMCDKDGIHLLLTTGGTGFSKRDITPEATLAVIQRRVSGIPEAMSAYSMNITKRAMLSRAEAGIRGNCLIINMPGSPKAVREVLAYLLQSIEHGLDILLENDSDCGG